MREMTQEEIDEGLKALADIFDLFSKLNQHVYVMMALSAILQAANFLLLMLLLLRV